MATLEQRLRDALTEVATTCKAIKTLLNGNAADNSALLTTAKNNLVAAINEVRQLALDASSAGGVDIDDNATNSSDTWSSTKIAGEIAAQIQAVIGASTPAALDTLDELAAAIGDDSNFAATITAALGNRVRVDAAQSFTAPQKAQARSNIDAYGSTELGNPDTDLVAVFQQGLL